MYPANVHMYKPVFFSMGFIIKFSKNQSRTEVGHKASHEGRGGDVMDKLYKGQRL